MCKNVWFIHDCMPNQLVITQRMAGVLYIFVVVVSRGFYIEVLRMRKTEVNIQEECRVVAQLVEWVKADDGE